MVSTFTHYSSASFSPAPGIATALKTLGYKVYDVNQACRSYKRDFPLWLEAAKAKDQGAPFDRYAFDRLTGKFDTLVGAPATFFAQDLVKYYHEAKVIVVTRKPDSQLVKFLVQRVMSPFLAALDPLFFGHISSFLDLTCKASSFDHTTIRANRLLIAEDITSWKDLCTFLEKPTPNDPFPATEADIETAAVTERAQDVWKSLVAKILESTALVFIYFVMLCCAAVAAFHSATRYTLYSRIKSMLFSAAVFIVGIVVFLLLNLVPKPVLEEQFNGVKVPPSPIAVHFQAPPVAVVTPVVATPKQPIRNQNSSKNQGHNNWNNRRGRQGPNNRSKPNSYQAPVARAPRPAPQLVAGWGNVQQQIAFNDMNTLKARVAQETATAHLPRATFQQKQTIRDGNRRQLVNENFE
jgi:hypothetical protein